MLTFLILFRQDKLKLTFFVFIVKRLNYNFIDQFFYTSGALGRRKERIRLMIGEIMAMIGEVPKKGKIRKMRMKKPYRLRKMSIL